MRVYAGTLLAYWRWVVWGALFALLVATAYLVFAPPVFRSEATVLVRTPGDISRVQDGGDSYARARTGTYASLASGSALSNRVVEDLGWDMAPDHFSTLVSAAGRPGTALIDLAVSAPSAADATRAATVLTAELGTTVRGLEVVPGSLVPRAELVVVDPPTPATRVLAAGLPVAPVLGATALLGAILGAVGAVVRHNESAEADLELRGRGRHRRT